MLNEGALTQQQTGGNVPTSNPQSVPTSNLQPQQQSGLQGMGSQVLGTSTFLEQSSNAAITVDGKEVNAEIQQLQAGQESSSASLQSTFAGKEMWVIGASIIIIAVLAYALLKQISREHAQA